jgi:hypothetical protein
MGDQRGQGRRSSQKGDTREDVGAAGSACNARAGALSLVLSSHTLLTHLQHGVGLSKGTLRALGHIHLCGVLYVAWQTRTAIEGQYMIALLYRDHLVLAVGGKSEHAYMVKAVVGLTDANIEEVDNGRGKRLASDVDVFHC